ncbi:DUF2975 domain-containing protein [uncultured Kriegella sp.]|uniref:DUF2975 domain-containing protein n=1 Tax=uncultured Kriegella sp. TaxID=1798910 RepID=UPI0030DAEE9B|tara:strand:+ start:49364 stop:50005 length:642 start_codon:yes stop_codon:yes gene_type:complete
MKTSGQPKSSIFINFLTILFRIGFFLLAFSLLIWVIYNIFIFLTDSPTTHMDFPVMFSLTEQGLFNNPGTNGLSKFYMQAMGMIRADDLPKGFLAIYSITTLLANICMLLSMRQVLLILESAKTRTFLIIENAIRLRWIGLLGIAIFLLEKTGTLISASFFTDKLEVSNLGFTSFNLFSFFGIETVFSSLFLLVISEAFRVGAQLKNEADLTI